MLKIKEVRITGHPVLGNLNLDFCGLDGRPVDTVIIAGENGVGKSTVMGLLYGLISGEANAPFADVVVEFDDDGEPVTLSYSFEHTAHGSIVYVADVSSETKDWIGSDAFRAAHPMEAIYSDVDINFNAGSLSAVTSLTLDSEASSRRSSGDLPAKINQLLIDVQNLDDADIAYAVTNNPATPLSELQVETRMPRFTQAFETMFDDLRYDRIDNRNGHKEIVFRKCGNEVPIDVLSSGEKQVVYRGCFLLKDANATKGAFVFIDEPEISLHPTWQKKIMDYYKAMFTDSTGRQTSQIFCVTHSPFIVHSESRRNDKVIVLRRSAGGRIEVSDRPEYYRCSSVVAVEDAFSVRGFARELPTVFLEGQTDERYYRRAARLFGVAGEIDFQWIGHHEGDDAGKGKFTGATALRKAYEFCSIHNPETPVAFLLDCDEHATDKTAGNVCLVGVEPFKNSRDITKGIENALVLDGIDLDEFYHELKIDDGYGKKGTRWELQKSGLCEFICGMGDDDLKVVFANLEKIICRLKDFFDSVR